MNRRPIQPGRVVVLRADRLGDLVLTTPLLRALAQARWQVDVVCRRDFLPVLENNPHVAAAKTLEDLCPGWPHNWRSLARHLRQKNYDAILIPHAAPPPLLWASAFSGAPFRLVLSGGKWSQATLHAMMPSEIAGSDAHYAQKVLALAGPLGAFTDDSRPEIFLLDTELAAAREALRERWGEPAGPVVVLHPGGGHLRSSEHNSACNLPITEYARLTKLILENTKCCVVITGGGNEASQIEPLWTPWRNHSRCWYAVGTLGLRPLTALLRLADLTIVGSTGPLHLASAVGAATLTPFCPAPGVNAATWGNQNENGFAIERSLTTCPRMLGQTCSCGDFQGEIDASHLFARAREILSGSGAQAASSIRQ